MAINQPQVPSSNFLVDLIPVNQRKRAYALYGLIGMLLGLIWTVVAAAVPGMPPNWLTAVVVGYNFLTPFFGALAAANSVPTGAEAIEVSTIDIEVDGLPVTVDRAEYEADPEGTQQKVRDERAALRLPEDGTEGDFVDYDTAAQFPDITKEDI